MSVIQLPNELIYKILDLLDSNSALNFSMCSKLIWYQFNNLLQEKYTDELLIVLQLETLPIYDVYVYPCQLRHTKTIIKEYRSYDKFVSNYRFYVNVNINCNILYKKLIQIGILYKDIIIYKRITIKLNE